MKIAAVHLSDIHLISKEDVVFSKLDKLSQAIISVKSYVDVFFLLCTGDISDKGKPNQFDAAEYFFKSLLELLKNEVKIEAIIMTPGNHDCNLDYDEGARQYFIKSADQNTLDNQKDNSLYNIITKPQSDFFEFEKNIIGKSPEEFEGLYSNFEYKIDQDVVIFHCCNTSAMYSKQDTTKLLFPFSKIKSKLEKKNELSCVLSHYPSNWFHPDTEASYRENVEPYVDFIFTGHRHEPDSVKEIKESGSSNNVFRGGRLQNHSNYGESTFNIIIIDIQKSEYAYMQYKWDHDYYKPSTGLNFKPYKRGVFLQGDFINNEKFNGWLNDPGILYFHPDKGRLQLSDIYTPGEIEVRDEKNKSDKVSCDEIVDLVLKKKKIYISSGDKGGKTTLAKVIYKEVRKHKIIPVMFYGRNLRHLDVVKPFELLQRAIEQQYSKADYEKYIQLPKVEKMLIVEDFDESKINDSDKQSFLKFIDDNFGITVLTGTNIFGLDELTSSYSEELFKYCRCSLVQCGHFMRGKLIERWLSLSTHELTDEEYSYKLKSIEHVLDEMLSKKMSMEPSPFVVITLLEKLSNPESNQTEQGSYGYLFRVIIDTVLINEFSNQDDLSVVHSFLAYIAYYMYKQSYKVINTEQVPEIIKKFQSKYLVEFSETDLRRLINSGIIVEEDDGYYFRHAYMYSYFIAHYLSLNMNVSKEEVQKVLKNLCENLLDNDNASIIMFYAFQSNQDPYLVDLIIDQAKNIFNSEKEFDLAVDADKLNKSINSTFEYIIPQGSSEEKRDRYLRQKDEEEKRPVETLPQLNFVIPEKSPLDRKSFELSLRMLSVLGQIIKNFPGSITTDTKLMLTNECYNTGLRTLSALARYFTENSEIIKTNLVSYVENNIPTKFKKDSIPEQRANALGIIVNNCIFMIASTYFLLVIKNISKPIGSPRLSLLFSKIKGERNNLSIDFIDVSIELDHFKSYPTYKIEQICNTGCKNNPFAKNLLASLVLDNHMNYPPSPKKYRTVQKVYSLLGIKSELPKIRSNVNLQLEAKSN
jgi:predicted MPP superfamily phosphohydrolase